MAKRNYNLNHSRNLMHVSRDITDSEVSYLTSMCTYRQKKLLFRLACTLEENGIEYGMNRSQVWNYRWNRTDAILTIDKWIALLKSHGIGGFGDGKQFSWLLDTSDNHIDCVPDACTPANNMV